LALLKRAKVVPFRTCCSLLKPSSLPNSSPAAAPKGSTQRSSCSQPQKSGSALVPELLGVCAKYGWLVQGNWVCKSQYVATGRTALCRDFLITQYATRHAIEHDSLGSLLEPQDALQLHEELGVRVEKEWHLKHPRDEEFIATFPAIVEQQAKLLKELEASLEQSLRSRAVPSSSAQPHDSAMSLVESQLTQLLLSLVDHHGVVHIQSAKDKFREEQEKNPQGWSNGLTEEILMAKLHAVYRTIGPLQLELYCRRSTGDAKYDAFRNVVIELLSFKPTITRKDVNKAILNKQLPDPTNADYSRVMKELAVPKGSTWSLKRTNPEVTIT